MTLTIYDAAMAGVVVLGMIWGAWKGVTWQLASIASLVVGYMVAHPASAQLAPRFPGNPEVARALAMMAVYAAVSAGIFLAAWTVRATLKAMKFEALDRHLGMILGGLEGAFIGVVATFFVVSLAPESRRPIFSSPAGRIVARVMDGVGPVLPSEAREALAPYIAQAKQAVAAGQALMPVVAPQLEANRDGGTDAPPTDKDNDIQRASHTDDDGAGTTQRR